MVGKEAAKTLLINDRLSELLINTNANLKGIIEVNGVLLGPTNLTEKSKEDRKQPRGWFDSVIDVIITLHNSNLEIKKELVKLHKEVIDK